MNKNDIIALLESQKTKNGKITNGLSKSDLIKSLLEGNLPSLVSMRKQGNKGEIVSSPMKKDEEKPSITVGRINIGERGASETEEPRREKAPPEEPKKEEVTPEEKKPDLPAKPEEPKEDEKLRADTKTFGVKSIIVNSGLTNIDEDGKALISDMFTEDEIVNMLPPKESDSLRLPGGKEHGQPWASVALKPIYGMVTKVGKKVSLYDPKQKSNLTYSGEKFVNFVKSLYMGVNKPAKEFKGKKHTFNYMPLEPKYNNMKIAVLPVSKDKYAVVIKHPETKNVYLMSMTPKAVKFYFNK